MRLLVVSPSLPIPANNGLRMRTWAILRALAAEGFDLGLLAFAPPGEPLDHLAAVRQLCSDTEEVPQVLPSLSQAADYAGRLGAMVSRLPYTVARFRSAAMTAKIGARLRAGNVDAILCETPYPVVNLPAALPVPLILDMHNIEHVLLKRFVSCERNPVKGAYAWLECRKLRRWERRAAARANMALVCSEHDRLALRRLCPQTPATVAPNVIDVNDYQPEPEGAAPMVLYSGGMDWYPNRDAVSFFVSEILPWLRARIPSVEFVVAGRTGPAAFLARFAGMREVRFTGTLADIRAEIAKAAVCVVPLRIGSGTRLKILEAAAMAKPIVCTRVGAEGLEFVEGKEILLADDPGAFARAVGDLLRDPARRRRLGQAARHKVAQAYSLPVLRAAIRRALSAVMAGADAKNCPAEAPWDVAEVRS